MVSISKVRPIFPTALSVKFFLHAHRVLKDSFFVPTMTIWVRQEASDGFIPYIADQESITLSSFAN